ncbi:MAG: thiamine pyrophosphate-dependent dehydrogenase E1 component subunit alpha [Alphaproteobacteria bacterium]|jgi:pyruvate dehydrogenase E1 component alpha subunit|nr:thiamine pyrophosphate-dependent dehydrogenase E1 component subunit alpha [Alphaproteobacteria bacterium]
MEKRVTQIDDQTLLRLHRDMLRIRLVEEAIAERYGEQEMRCPVHLSDGQEGIAAGACLALRKTDKIVSTHRSHGHYLAKQGSLKAMLCEIYGRAPGCVGGRGGSMHLLDDEAGVLACLPIVGTSVPLGVGVAYAAKRTGEDTVVMVFLGDAVMEEGVFHESANFAALHSLPVVFVCENNNLSFYTSLEVRQPDRPMTDIAKAHTITIKELDGNDAAAVFEAASGAVTQARKGGGPSFLMCNTRRWREHCGPRYDYELGQMTEREFEALRTDCPVARLDAQLRKAGLLDDVGEETLRAELGREISQAFEFACNAPFPELKTAGDHVYA